MSQFERTALLLGEDAIKALSRKKVAIFGLGGVGSWCCEALGRAGVGQLALIDHDTVSESNLNRQLVALHSTIGQPKAAVMAARLRDINPDIEITEYPVFYMPETPIRSIFPGLTVSWMPSIPSPPSCISSKQPRRWGYRSSAAWAPAISCAPTC